MKEFKRRTKSLSPTEHNYAVYVETLLLDSDQRTASIPLEGEEKVLSCKIDKLSWNLYRKERRQE